MLVPVYSEQLEPTQFSELPPPERTRQLEASRAHLYGVLLVDGRVVASTDATRLHPFDFCVQLGTSMQLQLLQVRIGRLGGELPRLAANSQSPSSVAIGVSSGPQRKRNASFVLERRPSIALSPTVSKSHSV